MNNAVYNYAVIRNGIAFHGVDCEIWCMRLLEQLKPDISSRRYIVHQSCSDSTSPNRCLCRAEGLEELGGSFYRSHSLISYPSQAWEEILNHSPLRACYCKN